MTLKEGERYKRGMKLKHFTFLSGNDEGQEWRLEVKVREDGSFERKGTTFQFIYQKPNEEKQSIRGKDRVWVYKNIPSSIWWGLENHHDWNDGGRMYLLSHNQHVIKTREERNGKNERG